MAGNTPAHGRKLEITAVGKTHNAIGRWGSADHPAHGLGVAGGSIGVGRFIGCTGNGSCQTRE